MGGMEKGGEGRGVSECEEENIVEPIKFLKVRVWVQIGKGVDRKRVS